MIQALSKRHMTTLEGAAPDYIAEVGAEIEDRLISLENILFAIYNLRELTPRSKDYVISFGERLLAPIVGAALRQRGIASTVMDGCEAGILTTPQHGESTSLPESDERIQRRIVPLLKKEIPVIMGFMGCTRTGSSRPSAGAVRTIPPPSSVPGSMRTRSGSGPMSMAS